MSEFIPHFNLDDIDGRRVNYGADLWQRKLAVLVSAATASPELRRDVVALNSPDVAVVVTPGPLPGVPAAAVAIVDRWGEIARTWDRAPSSAAEVGSWLEHVQMRCPECEGETR